MTPKTTFPMPRRALRGATAAGAIILAASLAGCMDVSSLLGGAQRDTETNEVTESGTESVFDIRIGDCLQEPGTADEVSDVEVVPCEEPHHYELYHEADVADLGDEWPGEDAIGQAGDQACYDEFSSFVGAAYEESEIWFTFYWPSEGSWAQGDHTVQCLVYEPADSTGATPAETAGSLRGAAR